jgi:two-component system, OmpR family, KDP operon response regulator KdpE
MAVRARAGRDLDLPARPTSDPTTWCTRNDRAIHAQRQMLEDVWGLKDTKTNYLRVFMVAIRRTLEPDPSHPRYFITEPGLGLRFVPEATTRDGEDLGAPRKENEC